MIEGDVRLYHQTFAPKGKVFSEKEVGKLLLQLPNSEGHVWSRVKAKKVNEVRNDKNVERDLAACEGNPNSFRFHRTQAPKGKQFTPAQIEELSEDWVDSPAKLVKEEDIKVSSLGEDLINDPSSKLAAVELLTGEGLNHSAWMRKMGLDSQKDRTKTKKAYDAVLISFGDKITMQDKDWFWKK